jgi:SAM-dependent methyltransferase
MNDKISRTVDSVFWDAKHQESSNFWLTGSDLEEIKRWHSISDSLLREKDVLEIGVGLGNCTAELSQIAKNLYASDISEVALTKINHLVKKTINTKQLKSLPSVDVAIAHLVFQHNTNEEICRIINDVNLKRDTGIFFFQFAEYPNPISDPINSFIEQKNHFFRSRLEIEDIVQKTNKKIINISSPHYFGHPWYLNWYFVQVNQP